MIICVKYVNFKNSGKIFPKGNFFKITTVNLKFKHVEAVRLLKKTLDVTLILDLVKHVLMRRIVLESLPLSFLTLDNIFRHCDHFKIT